MNTNGHGTARKKLAQRALERQLEYQEKKSQHLKGREAEVVLAMQRSSTRVRDLLETFQTIADDARVIEVGSGAHGLIFCFGAKHGVGVDPLAVSYRSLFPRWQNSATTVAAIGEQLPFANESFDVVLCDNVVDHAESPKQIVAELVRILKPGGIAILSGFEAADVANISAAMVKAGGRVTGEFGERDWRMLEVRV